MSKKKTPSWLRSPRWESVDLVDLPADEHARISIWKREDVEYDFDINTVVTKRSFSAEEREELAEKGHALPDGSFPIVNREDLSNAIQAFGRAKDKEKAKRHIIKRARALGEVGMLPDSWSVKKKEGVMPDSLDEAVRKSLDDEVLTYITDLEKKLEGAAGQPPSGEEEKTTVITKRDDLPEDVREFIAKQEETLSEVSKSLDETRKSLASEVEKREVREWSDRFSKLDTLQFEDRDKVIKSFRDLAATNPELAEEQFEALKKANEQASEGSLFAELGTEGSPPPEGSAEAELEAVVKSIQEEEDVDEARAWDLALDRRPDLYDRYRESDKMGA